MHKHAQLYDPVENASLQGGQGVREGERGANKIHSTQVSGVKIELIEAVAAQPLWVDLRWLCLRYGET